MVLLNTTKIDTRLLFELAAHAARRAGNTDMDFTVQIRRSKNQCHGVAVGDKDGHSREYRISEHFGRYKNLAEFMGECVRQGHKPFIRKGPYTNFIETRAGRCTIWVPDRWRRWSEYHDNQWTQAVRIFSVMCHEFKHCADYVTGAEFDRKYRRSEWSKRPEEIRAVKVQTDMMVDLMEGREPEIELLLMKLVFERCKK